MTSELSRIEQKVQDIVREGGAIREENERLLRKRVAELNVLESEAGKGRVDLLHTT